MIVIEKYKVIQGHKFSKYDYVYNAIIQFFFCHYRYYYTTIQYIVLITFISFLIHDDKIA